MEALERAAVPDADNRALGQPLAYQLVDGVLHALVGYTDRPSVLQGVVYLGTILGLWWLVRHKVLFGIVPR